MVSFCASRATIFNSKKLLTTSPTPLCLRSTSAFESLNNHDRIPTGNNLKPQEKLEDLICRMMSTRAWTTRLQNSIRSIAPSFDHELVYNVLHGAKNSEHALQFFRCVHPRGIVGTRRDTGTYLKEVSRKNMEQLKMIQLIQGHSLEAQPRPYKLFH